MKALPARNLLSILHRFEDYVAFVVLAVMSVLPLVEIVAREWLGTGVPGSISMVQHMTMWISFLGAALAARSDRLLALSTGSFLPGRWSDTAGLRWPRGAPRAARSVAGGAEFSRDTATRPIRQC